MSTAEFVLKLIKGEDGKGYFYVSFPVYSPFTCSYPYTEVKIPISQEHIDWIKNINAATKT